MFKDIFGRGKEKKSKTDGLTDQSGNGRAFKPPQGTDERQRNMFAGFQMLAAKLETPDCTAEDVVHFYREARVCGKTDEAMTLMTKVLSQRKREDYHSERRQVLAECIASLMAQEDYVENLNQALDYQGAGDPNQAMIEDARRALRLVGILKEHRCVPALASYNPLGQTEHDLWFRALSCVPDNRCAVALLEFLRRGRLFADDCAAALLFALRNYGEVVEDEVLTEIASLEGITYRALQKDGSYSDPQPLDCGPLQSLAVQELERR